MLNSRDHVGDNATAVEIIFTGCVQLTLDAIQNEVINSDISGKDLRIVLSIIDKYKQKLK